MLPSILKRLGKAVPPQLPYEFTGKIGEFLLKPDKAFELSKIFPDKELDEIIIHLSSSRSEPVDKGIRYSTIVSKRDAVMILIEDNGQQIRSGTLKRTICAMPIHPAVLLDSSLRSTDEELLWIIKSQPNLRSFLGELVVSIGESHQEEFFLALKEVLENGQAILSIGARTKIVAKAVDS